MIAMGVAGAAQAAAIASQKFQAGGKKIVPQPTGGGGLHLNNQLVLVF